MDTKNILVAVVLSTLIIVGWQVLVVDPELKKEQAQIVKTEQSKPSAGKPSAPSLNNKKNIPQKKITRSEAVTSELRVKLENSQITGSISLNGGLIDDVTLKNYKESLDKKSKQVV